MPVLKGLVWEQQRPDGDNTSTGRLNFAKDGRGNWWS